ncbi:GPN-loop GTPase QQT1 isoform X2 [Coffea arabica]|uniref:GPN-loop GTPase 2 n=1 Tax=Coffea arabica TaxID=13443 RepID=A0ABM4W1U2_COFAR
MVFGQVVIGPPGSGKTTYCNGMSQFLNLIGRKVAVVNLDPANDALPYECAVNIEDLVKLEDVMAEHSLGPNGGLVYCMDYLEKNIDWLESKLKPLIKAFNLDFYTDVQDLSYLQHHLDQDPRSAKYRKLTKELCEVIESYGLVNFTTLDIQDKESVGNLVKLIDKSNGYIFAGIEESAVEFSKIAVGPVDWDYYRVAAVQEKYMKDDEDLDLGNNKD